MPPRPLRLGVNIDHVATVRQARRAKEPDPVAAAALHAMHGRPAAPWTVAGLAAVAGVSRSTLAARFTDAVGQPPLEYLTRWRVALAARELRGGTRTLATIAAAVGYVLSIQIWRVWQGRRWRGRAWRLPAARSGPQ